VRRRNASGIRRLSWRLALNACLVCACALSLRAIDAAAWSRLTTPQPIETGPNGTGQSANSSDPTPVLPANANVPDELVGLLLNGTLYVPLRGSLRLIGGEVLNGAENGRVQTIASVGLVELEIGSTRSTVNARQRDLRAVPIIQCGTTYITARDFAKMFEVPMSTSDGGRTVTFTVRGRPVTAKPESDFYSIEIDRSDRRLTLLVREQEMLSFAVCVGRGRATPLGEFRVANKVVWPAWRSIYTGGIVPGGPGNPLGARWLGLTATGAGGHSIGIHGTNTPGSIGRAVSAGCIRMHNKDVIALHGKVMVGTPVHIHE